MVEKRTRGIVLGCAPCKLHHVYSSGRGNRDQGMGRAQAGGRADEWVRGSASLGKRHADRGLVRLPS